MKIKDLSVFSNLLNLKYLRIQYIKGQDISSLVELKKKGGILKEFWIFDYPFFTKDAKQQADINQLRKLEIEISYV